MEAVMPVAFSKSGAYLIKASVSGPATASTRTTLAEEPVLGVVPFEQAVASNAIEDSSHNRRPANPNLIGTTSHKDSRSSRIRLHIRAGFWISRWRLLQSG